MLENEPTGGAEAGSTPAPEAAPTTTTRRTRRRTAAPVAAEGAQPAAAEPAPQEADAPAPRRSRTRRKPVEADESGESGTEEAPPPARTRRKRTAAAAAPEDDGARAGETEPARPPALASPTADHPATASAEVAPPSGSTAARPARSAGAAALAGSVAPAGSVAAAEGTPAAGSAVPVVPPDAAAPPAAEPAERTTRRRRAPAAPIVLFMAPEVPAEPARPAVEHPAADQREAAEAQPEEVADAVESAEGTGRRRRRARRSAEVVEEAPVEEAAEPEAEDDEDDEDESGDAAARRRRRRGRRGRGRGKGTAGGEYAEDEDEEPEPEPEEDEAAAAEEGVTRRRRRRRRGAAAAESEAPAEDGVVTVVKVRQPRAARDEVQGVTGSTRLEAKRQRRRDGRDQRRTRPPILSESEFLARREAVDRTMVVRQKGDRTQIAVLEDGVLVEHYVTRASAGSMVGNVYLGKVQNVLPSMEAAFVDIGRGRNAVLYAGEVNWDATGLEGRARSIEQALKSGDSVLVQVTKDPVGHKGARLTSHIALSGRHLVYVPHGNASGISRKLPDNERKRLRDVLKHLIPDGAGVIVRTAAEGADEDELARDVTRLQAQWEDIQAKAAEGGAPVLLYEEPDLLIRVVRDLFNEDFRELAIQGSEAYDTVELYLKHVSPDLVERLRRYPGPGDVFAERRVDEQILKALDRKVFLPSGGSLVIDRTEAMTVIDVNTGKYTGTGGNLEETVTRNNLEAAEEIVRQLRLRDLGGIVVIDFIDMVLESNRELVLRRLTECLGRDRTKHQVTEITSLGLVQMTRKRIGQGLLEAFSETCEHCKGRGLVIHTEPASEKKPAAKVAATVAAAAEGGGRRRGRGGAAVVQPEAASETAVEDVVDAVEVVEALVGDAADARTEVTAGSNGGRRRRRGAQTVAPADEWAAEEWPAGEPTGAVSEPDVPGEPLVTAEGEDLEEEEPRRRGRRTSRRRVR